MNKGDIIYFRTKSGYIKYKVRQIIDDDVIVITYRSNILNCINKSDAIEAPDFVCIYNGETIYE